MSQPEPARTLVYKGRRYDVSDWIARHPGGRIIERFVGQDATSVLHMFHDMRQPGVQRLLQRMDLGPAHDHPTSAFDADYLALEELFRARGWFDVRPLWYVARITFVLALLAAAFVAPGPWLTGLFFGLFIQQSAFIAHDVCHNSVVPRRWRRRASWFFGSVCFGLDYAKWVEEHNLHHALASRPAEDPQMNSMPHLLYARREADAFERTRRKLTDWEKAKMGFQHIWLLPVLLLYGRINVAGNDLKAAWRARDRHFLSAFALHYALWIALLFKGGAGALAFAAAFIPTALAVSGIIHLQLILSHAYSPRLFEDEQRAAGMKLQVISNQNVTTTFLDDWFHGGLQHHIEHHLFPRMPRHNLARARPDVRRLCAAHGLEYRSDPFLVCVAHLMRSLYRESAHFRAELRARYLGAGVPAGPTEGRT
jgi:delta8-fatty-acid desaturase